MSESTTSGTTTSGATTSGTPSNPVTLRQIRRMLSRMADNARGASMTGALVQGVRAAVNQYNAVLQYLETQKAIPGEFFPPLAEDASFDEVGVAASQLEGFLEDDEESDERPWGGADDEREVRRAEREARRVDREAFRKARAEEREARRAGWEARRGGWRHSRPHGEGDADSESVDLGDLWELKNLGQIIRESIPPDLGRVIREGMAEGLAERERWIHQFKQGGPGAPPPPPTPGVPQAPPASAAPEAPPTPPPPTAPPPARGDAARMDAIDTRLAELSARLQTAARKLQQPDLDAGERAETAQEITRIAEEQAALAREASSSRPTMISTGGAFGVSTAPRGPQPPTGPPGGGAGAGPDRVTD